MSDQSGLTIKVGNYLKLNWGNKDRFLIEKLFIKNGGFITIKGVRYGHGLYHHYKAAITALWPHFQWHNWSDLLIQSWCEHGEVGVMGPASSGKTYCSAAFSLVTFYCWPKGTSVIMSSTTREGLQLRVWGAVKELHSKAKERRDWLPGRTIESRFMLTGAEEQDEAQDFRDGIIGVACKVGGQFVGLANYVGLKNDRVMLVADEASLMAKGFIDSVANLRKNPSFKLIAMGNPKDRTDALGVVCEPHESIGGWEGLTQEEKTTTWRTRAPNGLAIQICGYDSPNYRYPRGVNPFKGLITPEMIEADLSYYGKDSLQFSMMNLGMMPKDGGVRRVITRSLCDQNKAFEEAVWMSSESQTRVLGMDPAYSGVGGDRCPLIDLTFGPDANGDIIIALSANPIIVPVKQGKGESSAEDQIAKFTMMYAVANGIPPSKFGLDSTGKGSLVAAFARLWSSEIIPIEFGGLPSDTRMVRFGGKEEDNRTEREVYGKQVTALWFASRSVITGGQMRQLTPELVEDGSYREWGTTKSGKVDVEPKEKTKERMGRSPDLWDALVVAIEVARRNGFVIKTGAKVGITKTSFKKLNELADRHRKLTQKYQLTTT